MDEVFQATVIPADTRPHRLVSAEQKALRDERRHKVRSSRNCLRSDTRTEARRDVDRLIYSPSWMRLGGVTQVIATRSSDFALLHNRMTHSLRVAQVSRSIAELLLSGDGTPDLDRHKRLLALGGLDADVAEVAGLAHDIGHPPFGHAGEQVLDDFARNTLGLRDGFEGNAQTLRVVTKIERRYQSYHGLDLTRATRAALIKYPWSRVEQHPEHAHVLAHDPEYRRNWNKFNVYDDDMAEFEDARSCLTEIPSKTQSLEASIMDAADDISYAVHDLEDFILAGVIKLEDELAAIATDAPEMLQLAERLKLDYQGYFEKEIFLRAVVDVRSQLVRAIPNRFDGSPEHTGQVRWRCSQMIGEYIAAVELSEAAPEEQLWSGGPYLALSQPEWHQVQILKHITKKIVQSRLVEDRQAGDKAILELILKSLLDRYANNHDRLPRSLQKMLADQPDSNATKASRDYRCILDFVCTLTDGQTQDLFDRLYGRAGSSIGAWSEVCHSPG